jgi:branched-chain amino acid aminotransferase
MIGDSVIVNGRLEKPSSAMVSLDDTDATYGYGCYETLKIRSGVLYFPEFHEARLIRSAATLGIENGLEPGDVVSALELLQRSNAVRECNIKIMLIGRDGRNADWYAFMLPPVVPPASAYTDGVSCLLFRGERHFPQAKSLSMLLSTIAYRAAGVRGCYDALLVDGGGHITEGTRTNVFYVLPGEGGVVYTPPVSEVLEGITRKTLIEALAEADIMTIERPLLAGEALAGAASLMVTSTSSRVIPVRALQGSGQEVYTGPVRSGVHEQATELLVSPEIARVRFIYDEYLSRYAARFSLPASVENTLQ